MRTNQQLNTQLRERSREMADRLREKDERLQLRAELQQKETQLQQKEEELQQRNADISSLRRQLQVCIIILYTFNNIHIFLFYYVSDYAGVTRESKTKVWC